MSSSHPQYFPNANGFVLNNVSFPNIEGNYYNGAGELHTVIDKHGLIATLVLKTQI